MFCSAQRVRYLQRVRAAAAKEAAGSPVQRCPDCHHICPGLPGAQCVVAHSSVNVRRMPRERAKMRHAETAKRRASPDVAASGAVRGLFARGGAHQHAREAVARCWHRRRAQTGRRRLRPPAGAEERFHAPRMFTLRARRADALRATTRLPLRRCVT